MLGLWRSHAYYQKLIEGVNREFKRNPKSIQHFESAILKMYHLNLDNIKEGFIPRFSHTGKPSNHQPELFRSFILMSHFKFASIDDWVAHASITPLLCALVGVMPDEFPAASTHRDFMLMLWTNGKPNRVKVKFSKPKDKHGNPKLPLKHPGIIKKLVDKALDGQIFKIIPKDFTKPFL